MSTQATAAGRNMYYEGQHGAEDPDDTAARLALVAERDSLRRALADCRGPVEFDLALQQMLIGPGDGEVNAYRSNRVARLTTLLATIDAAQKGHA